MPSGIHYDCSPVSETLGAHKSDGRGRPTGIRFAESKALSLAGWELFPDHEAGRVLGSDALPEVDVAIDLSITRQRQVGSGELRNSSRDIRYRSSIINNC